MLGLILEAVSRLMQDCRLVAALIVFEMILEAVSHLLQGCRGLLRNNVLEQLRRVFISLVA